LAELADYGRRLLEREEGAPTSGSDGADDG